MSRYTSFFLLVLLLSISLTQTSRTGPTIPWASEEEVVDEADSEGCGRVGEDECLMRRTLAAHTDYIYTQGKNKTD